MNKTHPLLHNMGWYFQQNAVGIRTPMMFVPTGKKAQKRVLAVSAICREALVHRLRRKLQTFMTDNVRWGEKPSEFLGEADLNDPQLKQPGESYLSVSQSHITQGLARPHPKAGKRGGYSPYLGYPAYYPKYQFYNQPMSPDKAQDFLDFCDAIIGPITVLLNPDRYVGNWWQTSMEEATATKGFMRWYGIDNTALAHPALTSLYTGLARQCALLVRTGLRDQILACSNQKELQKCLTQSDPELALKLTKEMEPWIAVPAPKNGQIYNVPVPHGSFSKILALHKSLYTHGFEKTFGRNFGEGWGLRLGPYGTSNVGRGGDRHYSGIHSFMGTHAQNSDGKRIKELAHQGATSGA